MTGQTRIINKTLEFSDLEQPDVRATVKALKGWLWRWLFTGGRFAVNGNVKRRAYIRRHKMWEYSRGLALTGASAPVRKTTGPNMNVLDVGGAMTSTIFYLSGLGDRVVCLDIDEKMVEQTNRIAKARRLPLEARTDNLADGTVTAERLGVPDGFDRVYCFCVIEHVLPPGQLKLAKALGQMVRPGGQLCLTFDYGEEAPTEAPIRTLKDRSSLAGGVSNVTWMTHSSANPSRKLRPEPTMLSNREPKTCTLLTLASGRPPRQRDFSSANEAVILSESCAARASAGTLPPSSASMIRMPAAGERNSPLFRVVSVTMTGRGVSFFSD